MRLISLTKVIFFLSFGCPLLLAQQAPSTVSLSPYDLIYSTCSIQNHESLKQLRLEIDDGLKSLRAEDAAGHFCLAARLERVGDYRAKDFYEQAIKLAPTDANYEVLYADYLRNFRGALGPLFPQAEKHYFAAWKNAQPGTMTEQFVKRGLSALYQQDGVVMFYRNADSTAAGPARQRPVAFFTSIDRAAQSDADLDREADVRDYTSEVLFAQSSSRLNRPLTFDEVRGLLRLKKAFETLDRVRFRYGAWPVFDLFYTHRQTDNDQVTNFFCLTATSSIGCSQAGLHPFDTLRQNDYGVKAQKPFTAWRYFDVSLSATYDRTQRWGLIEFFPGSEESINNYETRDAVSHFFGPDKATIDFGYTYQAIHPSVPGEPNRDRQLGDASLTYQWFRPLPLPFFTPYRWRFETRGWDFFSGTLTDIESFGSIHVRRHDYFAGTALRGIGPFDFTVQPTWFTSRVEGDPSQHNTQYRTNANVLVRLVDEERNDGIPRGRPSGVHLAFLHLVIPFRDDVSRAGPNWFESHKLGAELDSKIFTYSRWTTFLASVRYDRVRFYHLDRNVNAFTATLSLGF
jgi:hypothetical protein